MTPRPGNTTKTTVNTAATISMKTTFSPFLRTAEPAPGREQ
jgi:hypothetical protein